MESSVGTSRCRRGAEIGQCFEDPAQEGADAAMRRQMAQSRQPRNLGAG